MNRWLDNLGLIISLVALGISLGFGFYVVRHVSEHQAEQKVHTPAKGRGSLFPDRGSYEQQRTEQRLEALEQQQEYERRQEWQREMFGR